MGRFGGSGGPDHTSRIYRLGMAANTARRMANADAQGVRGPAPATRASPFTSVILLSPVKMA
jgi:hypothetical protein